jgi:hypothetical protein
LEAAAERAPNAHRRVRAILIDEEDRAAGREAAAVRDGEVVNREDRDDERNRESEAAVSHEESGRPARTGRASCPAVIS